MQVERNISNRLIDLKHTEPDPAVIRLISLIGAIIFKMIEKDLISPHEARHLLEASQGPLRDGGLYPDHAFQLLLEFLRRMDPNGNF